jgi:5-methylcytosine-specific restriction endonuclease McrA
MEHNSPAEGLPEQTGPFPLSGEEEAPPQTKTCTNCNRTKPVSHFMKRSGRRSGGSSRRGICRACRKRNKKKHGQAHGAAKPQAVHPGLEIEPATAPRRRIIRPLPVAPPKPEGPDASVLRPTRDGIIRMRGTTDKGRRWYQETDLETAIVLVKEYAAVVVNPYTIRRLYSNKKFRRYILMRDQYTCHFCGEYGDTIDHLLPRAKGGHTTPLNCVCACNLCNQSKADRSLDDFMSDAEQ